MYSLCHLEITTSYTEFLLIRLLMVGIITRKIIDMVERTVLSKKKMKIN